MKRWWWFWWWWEPEYTILSVYISIIIRYIMDDSIVVHMFVCCFYCHIFHVFHVAHTKNRGIVWRSTRPLKVTWPRSLWMVPSSSSTHVQERATESVIRNAASDHPTRGGRIHFTGSTFVFSLSFWHRGQFPYKENPSKVRQTLEFLLRPDISCWGIPPKGPQRMILPEND